MSFFEAAQPYLAEGVISSVRLSTRPDAIDADVLKRLKKYGVAVVELGAQSMCDRVLELPDAGTTARRLKTHQSSLRPPDLTSYCR